MRLVSINFCGGCNPAIDRGAFARTVRAALEEEGIRTVFNDWEAPFIVRLSGCSANCAVAYHPVEEPGAAIAGTAFNAVFAAEEDLAQLAVDAVLKHFGIPPRR